MFAHLSFNNAMLRTALKIANASTMSVMSQSIRNEYLNNTIKKNMTQVLTGGLQADHLSVAVWYLGCLC